MSKKKTVKKAAPAPDREVEAVTQPEPLNEVQAPDRWGYYCICCDSLAFEFQGHEKPSTASSFFDVPIIWKGAEMMGRRVGCQACGAPLELGVNEAIRPHRIVQVDRWNEERQKAFAEMDRMRKGPKLDRFEGVQSFAIPEGGQMVLRDGPLPVTADALRARTDPQTRAELADLTDRLDIMGKMLGALGRG